MNLTSSEGYGPPERSMNPSSRHKPGAIIGMCAIAGLVGASSGQSLQGSDEQIIQTQCPIMINNRIIPAYSTVYRGNKVYFCCDECKPKFEKNPQKYLHLLPQFAGVGAVAGGEHAGHEDGHDEHNKRGFSTAELIVPMGVLTLSLVALTVCLGLLRRVRRLRPRLLLKLHKIAGICALGSGAIHATLVLLIH